MPIMSLLDRNRRILVVDDDSATHEYFSRILGRIEDSQDSGRSDSFGSRVQVNTAFDLEFACHGEDGLEKLSAALIQGEPYAMAFIDVRMPSGRDGLETAVKMWEVYPDLQIVMCTPYSDYAWDDQLRKVEKSDRVVILKKPFDRAEAVQMACALTAKWSLSQQVKRKVDDLEELVAERTVQLARTEQDLRAIFEQSPEGIFRISPDGEYRNVNPALARLYGYDSVEAFQNELSRSGHSFYVDMERGEQFRRLLDRNGAVWDFESQICCRDGSRKWIAESASAIRDAEGNVLYYQGFSIDVTARKEAEKQREIMELQLRRVQKVESISQMAAGIVHEINTPTQHISDNLRFLTESFASVQGLLEQYAQLQAAAVRGQLTPEITTATAVAEEQLDVSYLCEEIQRALRQSSDEVARVSKLVFSMKEFAHPGTVEMIPLDLNHAIETTLTVSRNEWRYVADLRTDLDPALPRVPCLPGELNQVILNLLSNAAHAIEEVVNEGGHCKGGILVSTRRDGNWAEIRVTDSGPGIPEPIKRKVFDPFFTTKPVGKGTGQGLAIVRSVVVDKHGGQIDFDTEMGKGTTFRVRLPISR